MESAREDATPEDAAELLEVAVAAAELAGGLLRERFEAGAERTVSTKSTPTDLVSEADFTAQRAIRGLLDERRPDDGFLGEEGGDAAGSTGLRWIVDPLDGTVNFLFGIPHWCVSVAVLDGVGGVAGVVHDAMRGETFAGVRGETPRCNGRPIVPRGATDLRMAMVATGFGYDERVRVEQGQIVAGLIDRVRDIRRFGSAALDMAWTAAGRYDAYYERGVHAWDVAAGSVLCRGVGLELREMPATETLPLGIVVAPAALVDELYGLVI
jgi:myo-inositol-1(or 4)-monophosphatase